MAKTHGKITTKQITLPKKGFNDLIKEKSFFNKQKVITVNDNIAIDNGPLTKIPKAKTNHIIEG
jgi:hypothetical protein